MTEYSPQQNGTDTGGLLYRLIRAMRRSLDRRVKTSGKKKR